MEPFFGTVWLAIVGYIELCPILFFVGISSKLIIFQNNDLMQRQDNHLRKTIKYQEYSDICTSNHMFKREIWDKFTEFTFLKF